MGISAANFYRVHCQSPISSYHFPILIPFTFRHQRGSPGSPMLQLLGVMALIVLSGCLFGFRVNELLGMPIERLKTCNADGMNGDRSPTLSGKLPINIAHRGSSGTHPEESSQAFEYAVKVGADYLECDIQVTKDDILICSHEPELSYLLTDIEDEKHRAKFPESGRREETIEVTNKVPAKRRGWFIADYEWDDIKNVHLVQRYIERDQKYNGKFPHLTVDQLLDLAVKSKKGIYLEVKDSTWYQSTRKKNTAKLLIDLLCRRGYCQLTSGGLNVQPPEGGLPTPIFLQSFCYDDLVYWSEIGATKFIPTVALIWDAGTGDDKGFGHIQHRSTNPGTPSVDLDARPVDLADLKRLHVSALGPDKGLIFNRPAYISEAHAEGLAVHAWTFRNEVAAIAPLDKEGSCRKENAERFIHSTFDGDVYKEMRFFFELGLDGYFTDYPGTLRNFLRNCRVSI